MSESRRPAPAAAPRLAVPVIGLAVVAVGLSTTIPLPLYGAYAALGGHGAGALAFAFACYALTVIVAAPVLGPLPERIGRRPAVLLGVALAALSTLLLAAWPGIPMLALARVAQGLAMGCITGAAAAWATELAGGTTEGARRAASVIAMATIGSFGVGGVLTLGAVLAWPGSLVPATFPAHLLVSALALVLAARLPETLAAPAIPGRRPRRLSFPAGTLATTLAVVPGWGTTGTILSSVQAALAEAGHALAGPVAGCAMMLVGVFAQRGFQGLAPRRAVPIGLGILLVGAGLAFAGAIMGWLLPLVVGAVVVGIAVYGFVYLGGLRAVAEAATGEDRAQAVAGYFLVAHVGFGVVPMAAGLAVDWAGPAVALTGLWLLLTVAALTIGAAIPRR